MLYTALQVTISTMRLLHVIHSMSPETGGPAESLRQRASEHIRTGDTVEVLSQDRPDAPFLKTLDFPVHAISTEIGGYGRSPELLQWLRQNVGRFDGVVVEGLWQYFNIAVRKAAAGRVPYAVFSHGMLDPWFKKQYPLKHLKKSAYWLPFQYPVLRDATSVLFTTDIERQLATESFWPHRWHGVVVPFGIAPAPDETPAQLERFFAAVPGVRGRRFVLFLARLHEKKGCDLLVEAYARVAGQYPEVDLVMAGPDADGLQKQLEGMARKYKIENRIHWSGMLQGETKWGAFHACEAFVLPSHQENFGVAVAEALACSKPVLISDKVNIWDGIKADGAGLVDTDTADGAERILRSWLEMDGEQRRAMSRRAQACYERRFSMSRCAEAIRQVFAR